MAKLKKGLDGKSSADGTLKIVKINKSPLDKKIRKFLELSEQTEKLGNELAARREWFDTILVKYENELKPILIDLSKYLYRFADNIYVTSKKFDINKEQRIELDEFLIRMLYNSFEFITPDSKQNALFISIAGYDYLQEKAENISNMEEDLRNEISDYFGYEVDFSQINMNILNFDEIANQIIKQFIEKGNALLNIPFKIDNKQFVEMLNKMYNHIKLSIADDLKENKITVQNSKIIIDKAKEAYRTDNLLELFKLEIKYYATNPEKLNDIQVERIDFYIKMMNDNIEFLKHSFHNLAFLSKYDVIFNYIDYIPNGPLILYDNAKSIALSIKKQMEILLNQFEAGLSKNDFFELIDGELSDIIIEFEEEFRMDDEDDDEDWEEEDNDDDDGWEEDDDQYSFFDDDIDKKP
ncbi:MAG: hypothetical protein RO257_00095 [Candidatus Kapabacteria bacterium]|nr:hypothetical protein [Candidatus Kapabacteria bacterium]